MPDVSQPHSQWLSPSVRIQCSLRLDDGLRGPLSADNRYEPPQQWGSIAAGTNGATGVCSREKRPGAREECPLRVSCDQHQIFSHEPENLTTAKSTRTSKIHIRKPLEIRDCHNLLHPPSSCPPVCAPSVSLHPPAHVCPPVCAPSVSLHIFVCMFFVLFVKCFKLCLLL